MINKPNNICDLPPEALLKILDYLPLKELATIPHRLSKLFFEVSKGASNWAQNLQPTIREDLEWDPLPWRDKVINYYRFVEKFKEYALYPSYTQRGPTVNYTHGFITFRPQNFEKTVKAISIYDYNNTDFKHPCEVLNTFSTECYLFTRDKKNDVRIWNLYDGALISEHNYSDCKKYEFIDFKYHQGILVTIYRNVNTYIFKSYDMNHHTSSTFKTEFNSFPYFRDKIELVEQKLIIKTEFQLKICELFHPGKEVKMNFDEATKIVTFLHCKGKVITFHPNTIGFLDLQSYEGWNNEPFKIIGETPTSPEESTFFTYFEDEHNNIAPFKDRDSLPTTPLFLDDIIIYPGIDQNIEIYDIKKNFETTILPIAEHVIGQLTHMHFSTKTNTLFAVHQLFTSTEDEDTLIYLSEWNLSTRSLISTQVYLDESSTYHRVKNIFVFNNLVCLVTSKYLIINCNQKVYFPCALDKITSINYFGGKLIVTGLIGRDNQVFVLELNDHNNSDKKRKEH